MKEKLDRRIWNIYIEIFCEKKKLSILTGFTELMDHLAEEKSNLIAELDISLQNLFRTVLLEILVNQKSPDPITAFPDEKNEAQWKNIILICASRHKNEWLNFLMRAGAGKYYEKDKWLDEKSHPIYVCGRNDNTIGLRTLLQYAPYLHHIPIQRIFSQCFPGHLFCLDHKIEPIKTMHKINPELLDYKDSNGRSVAHFVFAGLEGDPHLPALFSLVFALCPQLFIQKDKFEKTPWDLQRQDHPSQTPAVLLGTDYDNPVHKPYLPPKHDPGEIKQISPLVAQTAMRAEPPPGPPNCPGFCLIG